MNKQARAMRDVFIAGIHNKMKGDRGIFFLTADLGSPELDGIRSEFGDRFINVGIAEQNLINVGTGLALEGFTVFAYALAPFLTMRAFEQIRNNLSIQSRYKDLNLNLIGVGAGLSYDVSGPTHHCLEDIAVMRALPNIKIFSPSDWVLAKAFLDYSISNKSPKYLRFDAKPLVPIYPENEKIELGKGFCELRKSGRICVVSTGFMTHSALKAVNHLRGKNIEVGLIDVFMIEPFNEKEFIKAVRKYDYLITIEEGFVFRGGMDTLIAEVLKKHGLDIEHKSMGFKNSYIFKIGSRDYLHKINKLDEKSIELEITRFLRY